MGGSRCSYRDCTANRAGNIHMFHFPVFDKLRCHQWITNAQKPEFLNLKLSQLKNRVICQHHFKDNNFMNYMKDKLTFNAVPTEFGPFCQKVKDEVDHLIPINVDDIDNDGVLIPQAKKSQLSVKYSDFLTSDISEVIGSIPTLSTTNKINHKNDFDLEYKISNIKSNNFIESNKMCINNNKKTVQRLQTVKKAVVTKEPTSNTEPAKSPAEQGVFSTKNDPNIIQYSKQKEVNQPVEPVKNTLNIKPSKKVSIISEKQISEPVKVKGKLKPVPPSFIIQIPRKKKEANQPDMSPIKQIVIDAPQNPTYTISDSNTIVSTSNNVYNMEQLNLFETNNNFTNDLSSHTNITYDQNINPTLDKNESYNQQMHFNGQDILQHFNTQNEVPIEFEKTTNVLEQKPIPEPLKEKENVVKNHSFQTPVSISPGKPLLKKQLSSEKKTTIQSFKSPVSISPGKSLLKNQLPPEKIAAIEEKRKFNMKIRDIINSCLNKLDDKESMVLKGSKVDNQSRNSEVSDSSTVINQPEILPKTLACLEARLQKMEKSLTNKIDQNTQRIIEIKRSLNTTHKKTVVTQTHVSEDVQKRQLYQEISQYLSPNTNSLIYEELFINNKFTKNEADLPRKRRRRL